MNEEIIDVGEKETSLVKASATQAVSRPPAVVLKEAQAAAQALRDVITNPDSKRKKLILGGKQYLIYEDWLLLGQFYNAYCRTHDAVEVTVAGVRGAKARAEVLDRNGVVIGGAEAFCMRDEDNWADKPFFQLASMAQTRAGSKAMANRLRWVAVLAEFEGTPAEEMGGKKAGGSPKDFGEYNKQHNDTARGESIITEKQQKLIFAKSKAAGMDNEMRNAMLANLGYASSKEVKKKDMDEIIRQIDTYGKPADRKAGEDDVPI